METLGDGRVGDTWARMAAFCPAVTRMACWGTGVVEDVLFPPEGPDPGFPDPGATGWPTRNVPWKDG